METEIRVHVVKYPDRDNLVMRYFARGILATGI